MIEFIHKPLLRRRKYKKDYESLKLASVRKFLKIEYVLLASSSKAESTKDGPDFLQLPRVEESNITKVIDRFCTATLVN